MKVFFEVVLSLALVCAWVVVAGTASHATQSQSTAAAAADQAVAEVSPAASAPSL